MGLSNIAEHGNLGLNSKSQAKLGNFSALREILLENASFQTLSFSQISIVESFNLKLNWKIKGVVFFSGISVLK